MKPEQELEPWLGVTDVVLIELMRSDEDFSKYRANIDMNVRSDVKRKFRKDSGTWLPRLVAERATLYCERKQDLDTKALRSKLNSWIYSGVFGTIAMLLILLFFHAIGTTQWLFSSNTSVTENTASIGKLIWLLVIPPLFSILPLVTCINLLLRKQKANAGGSGSRLSKLAGKLSIPGLIEGAWHVLQDLRGSEESMAQRSLERFAEKKGEIASTLFVAISNALVLLLSIAVLLAVSSFLTFNEVKYTWKSSLVSASGRAEAISWLSKLVPYSEPPSEGAFEWAFGTKSHGSESNLGRQTGSSASQSAIGSDKTLAADSIRKEDELEKPTVSIEPTSATSSASESPMAAQFEIRRIGTPRGELKVKYSVSGSTKQESEKKEPGSTVIIPDGSESTTIEFKLLPKKYYDVGISRSSTVAVEPDTTAPAEGTQAEVKTEKPSVSIKTISAGAFERDPLDAGLFVISRTGSKSEPLTVEYGVGVQTGSSEDATGSAIIPEGRDSITLKLNLLADDNGKVGDNRSATVEIVDNQSNEDRYRSEWSRFVLYAMFVLSIVPRLFIGCLSAFLIRRSWCSLIPNADDPDVERIVDNVMGEKVSSSTITNVPDLQPREEHPASAAKPELLSKPRRVSNRLIFVAYSLLERDIAAIRNNGVCKESELKLPDGAAERSAFLAQLGENPEIHKVIVLVRATTVPDQAFSSFLAQISHNQGGRDGAMKMLIVGAKEHLERVAGDTFANRSRLDLWRSAAFSCGMKTSDVLELDLESDDLKSRLATWLTEPIDDAADARVKMAGKFDTTLSHVEKELIFACSSETISSSADWEVKCDQVREQVIKIYANEYQRLVTEITDTSWGDVASDIAPDIGVPAGVQATLGKVLALRKYFETLSPKWMLAGAIAGVGATAALPLLVGGTVGLPVLLAALPYAAGGGAVSAQAIRNYWLSRSDGDDVSTSDLPEYEGMNLDVVTRALLLFVILLEYQENSHDVLAGKVEQQLKPLGEFAIDSQEKMSAAVEQLRQSLRENLEAVA